MRIHVDGAVEAVGERCAGGEDRGGYAVDHGHGLPQDPRPEAGIERGIVDIVDEARQFDAIGHAPLPAEAPDASAGRRSRGRGADLTRLR
jgi:hypothetical protein